MTERGTTISIDPDEGEFDPPLAFEKGGALWALAEIRQRTGVGMAPMLSELPDAVMGELAALKRQRDEANNTAMHHLASIAELDGRVKMYAVDLADLRREAAREITRLIEEKDAKVFALRARVKTLEQIARDARPFCLGLGEGFWEGSQVADRIVTALSGKE